MTKPWSNDPHIVSDIITIVCNYYDKASGSKLLGYAASVDARHLLEGHVVKLHRVH